MILNLGQWYRRRCCLKDFISGALASLFLVERNHLYNFGWGKFKLSYFKVGPVFQEEMSFKEMVYERMDTRRMQTDHNSSPRAFRSGELKNLCIFYLLVAHMPPVFPRRTVFFYICRCQFLQPIFHSVLFSFLFFFNLSKTRT